MILGGYVDGLYGLDRGLWYQLASPDSYDVPSPCALAARCAKSLGCFSFKR